MDGKKLYKADNGETEGRLYFNKKRRLISISGAISWQMADEALDAALNFRSLSPKKPVTIFISSNGGDIYAMFKIYDLIKNSPFPIITIVAGSAASAGLVLFLAGDLRMMFPHAFLGFHSPTYFFSNANESPAESKESAFHQNCLLEAMIAIIKNNSNMSNKSIKKYLSILTRIDAKTALKFGLAHRIIDSPAKTLPKSWQKIIKEQK